VLHFIRTFGDTHRYWLWPLPPPGPVTFSCRWPAYGIDRSDVVVDGVHAAARRSQPLWA
jgi:hypothetical protein